MPTGVVGPHLLHLRLVVVRDVDDLLLQHAWPLHDLFDLVLSLRVGQFAAMAFQALNSSRMSVGVPVSGTAKEATQNLGPACCHAVV